MLLPGVIISDFKEYRMRVKNKKHVLQYFSKLLQANITFSGDTDTIYLFSAKQQLQKFNNIFNY